MPFKVNHIQLDLLYAGGARINGTGHGQVGVAIRERHKKRPFLLERAS